MYKTITTITYEQNNKIEPEPTPYIPTHQENNDEAEIDYEEYCTKYDSCFDCPKFGEC
jgi:hypothetical protein